jgi:hypothetical protein
MTRYKEILSDFKTISFAEQVELGDDKRYKIEGVGSISFKLESGVRLHVDEVLYVPGLKKNLISIATLEDKGYVMSTFWDIITLQHFRVSCLPE